jgi:hypothetical protein
VVAAKEERFACALGMQRSRFVHRHATDGVDGHVG